MLKVGKYDKAQMEMGRMFRGVEISMGLESAIDQGLLRGNSIGGIAIAEVLTALESDAIGLKPWNTFRGTKGSVKLKYSWFFRQGVFDLLLFTAPVFSRNPPKK